MTAHIANRDALDHVLEQHVDNVCVAWSRRRLAVDEPHYAFDDLEALDERIEANLDGLRIAGDAGVGILEPLLDAVEEGAHFARASLAIERGDHATLAALHERACAEPNVRDELVSAFAWASPRHLRGLVGRLLASGTTGELMSGLQSCAVHGRDPGKVLGEASLHADVAVRVVAVRIAADRRMPVPPSADVDESDDERSGERFERARADLLGGEHERGRVTLERIVMTEAPGCGEALEVLMLTLDSSRARRLLGRLDRTGGRERDVVRGFGILGDPYAMNWLLERCDDPALARLAGDAIGAITGVDLERDGLERDEPTACAGGGPSDDPSDDDVTMDEDDMLPWPDPEPLREWWRAGGGLPAGVPCIDGAVRDAAVLARVLSSGRQPRRRAAAFALALSSPDVPVHDVRAPCARQRAWLADLATRQAS